MDYLARLKQSKDFEYWLGADKEQILYVPPFRSVFPCEAILCVEMSFWGSICCYEDFRGFLGLAWA